MSPGSAFRRLVLGDAAPRAAGEDVPGASPVEAVAAAWRDCAPELERRSAALTWEDEGPPAGTARAPAALSRLPAPERAAVAAQAVGLAPPEIETALGVAPGGAPPFLARGHAALAGLGLPAGAACARERERVAGAPGTRGRHCGECRAFAAAVGPQARALARAAGRPRGPGALRAGSGRARAVALSVAALALGALAGFGLVSALERDGAPSDSRVVTATPVGPLPPGVGPAAP